MNGMWNKDELRGIYTHHTQKYTQTYMYAQPLTHTMQFVQTAVHT